MCTSLYILFIQTLGRFILNLSQNRLNGSSKCVYTVVCNELSVRPPVVSDWTRTSWRCFIPNPPTPLLPLGRAWLKITAANTHTHRKPIRHPKIHRWFHVWLLVCSDGSSMRTRLLYIYSQGRDFKTCPLFILLGITLRYKEIMSD